MVPNSRTDAFLSVIAGVTNEKPQPVTREDYYLDLIADRVNSISQEIAENVFLVNYTVEFTGAGTEEEEYTITCNKTAEEIYSAYTSGKNIVALLYGNVILTLTRCFRKNNAPYIYWTALCAAEFFSSYEVDQYSPHNLKSIEITHQADSIQIDWETIVTRGSVVDFLDWRDAQNQDAGSNNESDP